MRHILSVLFLSLLLGSGISAFAQTPTPITTPLTVTDTDKPIRVDGYLVDWPETRMILLNKKSQVSYGILNWKSPDDFSGRIFLTYDSQYLYLSAIVQKPSGVVNGNNGLGLWDGDCIELFLSAGTSDKHPKHITKGDYHIGFSPGTGCHDPQIYCFNKETAIGGARISARPSLSGYILEACVPLTFFDGLEIGPGKTTRFDLALDEGGSSTGNRMLQLDLTGNPKSWKDPSLWTAIRWIGKTTVSVPPDNEENLYADLVKDGTKTETFWGHRTLTGLVVDDQGAPLADALVTTWPHTLSTTTDKDGRFTLDHVKTYDRTVVYASLDGYGASLAPIERQAGPVTVRLAKLPKFLTGEDDARPGFYGQAFQVPPSGDLPSLLDWVKDWCQLLPVNFLKLVGTENLRKDEAEADLDSFVAYARRQGAEPMIELPIRSADPESVADWVRHCNLEKGEKVLYWTIGDEPDLYAEKSKDPNFADYNVYDYINDFRNIYNAVKRVDPSVLILGPELAWRYTSGEDDWFTPFIQFDGDIVNLASIHHYAAVKAALCTPEKVMNDVRHMQTLTRGLEDRLAINSDFLIPLVLTGGNVCLESTDNTLTAHATQTPSPKAAFTPAPRATVGPKGPGKSTLVEDSGPRSFWAAIWQAQEVGVLLTDQMPMAFSSYLAGNGALDFFDNKGARPDYWALRLLSGSMRGKSIWAQAENGEVSVYAVQDPKTKDVSLLLINRGGRYYHPKILLNAKDANVSVDAGLEQTYDFELPFYSIAVLRLKADRSPGTAYLFTQKMAQAGKPPSEATIKPW